MLTFRKPWLIALLLLALVSQSVAALTMKCGLQQRDNTHASHTMADLTHRHHEMGPDIHHEMGITSTQAVDVSHISDCCNTKEHCVSGSCSLPALGHHLTFVLLQGTGSVAAVVDSKLSIQPVSSLYRPPIFR